MEPVVCTLTLGAGYAFLGAFVLTLLYAFLNKPIAWRDMFSESPGEPQHVSRYAVFLGTVWLAARFLSAVLAQPHNVGDALKIFDGFDMKDAVGTSSAAYLLAKVSNGQILSLFGKSQ